MSRACFSAADSDISKSGDSTEPSSKTEEETEVPPERRIYRTIDREDPEYWRQREMFLEQFKKSEGYDLEWEKFDYEYAPVKFECGEEFDDELSNDELMELLIKTAIDEENEEYETQLEFVKYVSANVMGVQGFCFYITLWAKDVSSPNQEPKLYRTKVRKFRDEIDVVEFKLRPTQE